MPRRRRHLLLGPLLLGAALLGGTSCAPRGPAVAAPPAPEHDWNQTHRIDLSAGWVVTARNVGPHDESTSLEGPNDHSCLVSVTPSGPITDARPQSPHQVMVQGHRGWYGPLDKDYGPYPRAVVWAETEQRSVEVSCDLDEAGILAMAERVRSEPNPVQLPFRLSSVPDGLTLEQLIESAEGPGRSAAALFRVDGDHRSSLEISNVVDLSFLDPAARVERVTLAGRAAEVRRTSQSICLPSGTQPVCVLGPVDELATDWSASGRALAEAAASALTPVDDPADVTSWLPVDEALPG